MKTEMTRRGFLKASSAFALFNIVPSYVLAKGNSPNGKPTKAIIGMGSISGSHLNKAGTPLVAVCDVDENRLNKYKNRKGVRRYRDFRELLEQPDIDIVHIATPPHWHGIMSILAADAGKDVWCEKPMTRTIGEGIKVMDAVRRNGTIFRINTWFRFQSRFYGANCLATELKKAVMSGMLGWPVKATLNGQTGMNWKFNWSGKTDLKPEPVPKHLDYDMWLGPAPFKPYAKHRTHGTFRGYWDYDGGGLGDMGQHYLDPIQYILGKDHTSPVTVEVDAPQQHPDAVGRWNQITLTYADGCQIIVEGTNKLNKPALLEGPKGKIFKGMESDIPNLRKKLASLPAPPPQNTDFLKCVQLRQPFTLNETNGHRSTTLINLAKIAVRLGRNLKYDPVKQTFIDDDGANSLIHQPMRAPWQV